MKSWGWLFLFVLTVLASVYLWKKTDQPNPGSAEPTSSMPIEAPPPVRSAMPPNPGVPAPRIMPNPSEPRGYAPEAAAPQAPNEVNGFRDPEIPPPPPVGPSFPESESPEYFDGEPIAPPFEPPPPLDDGGIPSQTVPPPVPVEPEGLE